MSWLVVQRETDCREFDAAAYCTWWMALAEMIRNREAAGGEQSRVCCCRRTVEGYYSNESDSCSWSTFVVEKLEMSEARCWPS